jgi:tRNA modification GTPase
MDTIYALATATGVAGVAVIRVSGPGASVSCRAITGLKANSKKPRVSKIVNSSGGLIDRGLVLWFDEGKSFTGEATAEYQVHGSSAVVRALLEELSLQPKHRLASPGEFTRRALENGRLDLTQIEGLADLLNSETEAQRRQAIRVFEGSIGQRVEGWRKNLIRAAALIEVTIDFSDEDVPEGLNAEVADLLRQLISDIEAEIKTVRLAERLRGGFEIAIVGSPNVGKSTLLNALAGRDAAITSSLAGTTRDVIEVKMDLEGIPVTFLDTAGLRDSNDEIETLGISLTKKRANRADIRVFLGDKLESRYEIEQKNEDIVISGKADLTGVGVSGLTGFGIHELISNISEKLKKMVSSIGVATHDRHRRAMQDAVLALKTALSELKEDAPRSEVIAEELRQSASFLEKMVGKVGVEVLLDEIFASFCLGK